MNLNFGILWIEDQQDSVEQYCVSLKRELLQHGFRVQVEFVDGFRSLEEKIESGIDKERIDLILVDYDLGNTGGNGGVAAQKIRDVFRHREIVFYSSNPTEDLRKIAYDNEIDGVYFANRVNLSDDVLSVIKNILRKVIDMSHMRGIVIAESSDLDYLMKDILRTVFDSMTTQEKEEFHGRVIDRINSRFQSHTDDMQQHDSYENFGELLDNPHLMTNDDRVRSLIRYFQNSDLPDRDRYHETFVNYRENFQSIRNRLAHVTDVTENGRRILRDKDEEEITDETMQNWRTELLRYRAVFEEIKGNL